MFKKKLTLLVITIVLISIGAKAQDLIGIGASAIYNFQSEGIGIGARVHIPFKKRIVLVPQVNYFAPFNIVHEFNAGINVNYNVVMRKKLIGYLTAGGYFNYWFNSDASPMPNAKTINISPDLGAGLLFGKRCFKPFVEQRYNPLFQEGSFHLGFLWFPGCVSGRNRTCPAYM